MHLCDFIHGFIQSTFINAEHSAVTRQIASAPIEVVLQINRVISDIDEY